MIKKNLLFFFLASLSLGGCTRYQVAGPDTLVTAISAPVQTLNPLFTTDANSQRINELAHAALVTLSESFVPEPWLAESYKVLNDKTIEFTLKPTCKFETGDPVTSSDVRSSIELYAGVEKGSTFSETARKISRVEILSPLRFRLHTKLPEPALLVNLIALKILPGKKIIAPSTATVLPGAGPYRVTELGTQEVSLVKNPVSCLPAPEMGKILVKTVRDDISRYLKLRKGELDIVLNDMNYRKVELALQGKAPELLALSSPGNGFNYLSLNMKTPALQDVRVRRALALSLDIPKIIAHKGRGMALQARNILSDSNAYANHSVPILVRNLPEARRLLDEAGYFNGANDKPPLRLAFKTTSNSISIENAQVMQAQVKEAGIMLDHRAYEWGIFLNDVKNGHGDVFLSRWVGVVDPGIYYDVFHSERIGKNNRTFYSNPAMDKATSRGQSTLDPTERKRAFAEAQEIAAKDLPYINLWHSNNTALYRKNILNVRLHPSGSWIILLKARKE